MRIIIKLRVARFKAYWGHLAAQIWFGTQKHPNRTRPCPPAAEGLWVVDENGAEPRGKTRLHRVPQYGEVFEILDVS